MPKKKVSRPGSGFAQMKRSDPDRFKRLSSTGGQVSQANGAGHRWTQEEAAAVAKKGAKARWRHKKIGGKPKTIIS